MRIPQRQSFLKVRKNIYSLILMNLEITIWLLLESRDRQISLLFYFGLPLQDVRHPEHQISKLVCFERASHKLFPKRKNENTHPCFAYFHVYLQCRYNNRKQTALFFAHANAYTLAITNPYIPNTNTNTLTLSITHTYIPNTQTVSLSPTHTSQTHKQSLYHILIHPKHTNSLSIAYPYIPNTHTLTHNAKPTNTFVFSQTQTEQCKHTHTKHQYDYLRSANTKRYSGIFL